MRPDLGDGASLGGRRDTLVIFRTRCGWAMFGECGEMRYGKTFPPKLKVTVYMSDVRPANPYGNKAWCLKVSKIRDL